MLTFKLQQERLQKIVEERYDRQDFDLNLCTLSYDNLIKCSDDWMEIIESKKWTHPIVPMQL